MLDWSLLQNIFGISLICSTITISFIQKTKKYCPNSKCIVFYSLIVNFLFAMLFSCTFFDFNFLKNIWVGLFSFLDSDTIYRLLEGKIPSYSDLVTYESTSVSIETEDIVGDIDYE